VTCALLIGIKINDLKQHTGLPCLLESLYFFLKFPGPGKFWKMSVVLGSPRNYI